MISQFINSVVEQTKIENSTASYNFHRLGFTFIRRRSSSYV